MDKSKHFERQFAKAREQDPDISFGQYYVRSVLQKMKAEGQHTTIGPAVPDAENWREAGLQNFRRVCRMTTVDPARGVVDYGCGSLRIGQHFIRHLEPGCYMGMDVTDDFIRIGLDLMDEAEIAAKRPHFGLIDDDAAVAEARKLEPQLLLAHGVHFHIHPDEMARFYDNVAQIAFRPGTSLIFNTNIADQRFQCGPRDWAWPLDEIKSSLSAFTLRDMQRRGELEGMVSYYLLFERL
jgi:hypothetical protein